MKRKSLDYYLSLNYKIIVQRESLEDEVWYIAYCNELGKYACYGQGITYEEALSSFHVEKEVFIEALYFQNKSIPEPIPDDDLISYSGIFNVRTTPEMHGLLIQQASDAGVSLNKFVNTILAYNAGVQRTFHDMLPELEEIKQLLNMHHSFVSDKLNYRFSSPSEIQSPKSSDDWQYAIESDWFKNRKAS